MTARLGKAEAPYPPAEGLGIRDKHSIREQCTLLDVEFPKCADRPFKTKEQFDEFAKYALADLKKRLDGMYASAGCSEHGLLLHYVETAPLPPGQRKFMAALPPGCELIKVTYDWCVINGKTVWCVCETYQCPGDTYYTICREYVAPTA